jgi:uncharacterized protein YnzC (UPF0291/DUF896 family)
MPQITIEVPEGLAERLEEVKARMAEEMTRWQTQASRIPAKVHRAILEFLGTNPSPREIVDFKFSPATQERIRELLEKNRERELTAEESAELDDYERLNRFVRTFKVQAIKDLLLKLNDPAGC